MEHYKPIPTANLATHINVADKVLRELLCEVEAVVSSEEFNLWVNDNQISSVYGHCAAAVDAMQILAWVMFGKYLKVLRIDSSHFHEFDQDVNQPHYVLVDPRTTFIYDPSKYQFGGTPIYTEAVLCKLYDCGKGSGLQGRRRQNLTSPQDYTTNLATKEIIRKVLNSPTFTKEYKASDAPRKNPIFRGLDVVRIYNLVLEICSQISKDAHVYISTAYDHTETIKTEFDVLFQKDLRLFDQFLNGQPASKICVSIFENEYPLDASCEFSTDGTFNYANSTIDIEFNRSPNLSISEFLNMFQQDNECFVFVFADLFRTLLHEIAHAQEGEITTWELNRRSHTRQEIEQSFHTLSNYDLNLPLNREAKEARSIIQTYLETDTEIRAYTYSILADIMLYDPDLVIYETSSTVDAYLKEVSPEWNKLHLIYTKHTLDIVRDGIRQLMEQLLKI